MSLHGSGRGSSLARSGAPTPSNTIARIASRIEGSVSPGPHSQDSEPRGASQIDSNAMTSASVS